MLGKCKKKHILKDDHMNKVLTFYNNIYNINDSIKNIYNINVFYLIFEWTKEKF